MCFDRGYMELWIDPDSQAAAEVRQKLSKKARRDREDAENQAYWNGQAQKQREEKRRDDSWN